MTYKEEVEARLRDNPGCGWYDVLAVGSTLVLFTAIHRGVAVIAPPGGSVVRSAGLQFALVCAPMIIPYCGYASPTVISCMATVAACVILVGRATRAAGAMSGVVAGSSFITTYRALLMLSTCFCILAVDFDALFPRLFMKTETFGISVMDIGVGCFVFSAGYVSRRQWKIASMIPLLTLGFLRMAMVKIADYPEHVAEYGVHWNFFFTLAAMPVLTNTIVPNWPASVVAVVGYQVALSCLGLTDYMQHSDRLTLFRANREGIFSAIGYAALYHSAQRLRPLILTSTLPQTTGFGCLLLALAIVSDTMVQPFSRRFCNVSYVLFVVSFNVLQLSMFRGVELALPISETESESNDVLFHSINRNSMFVFLVANVFTGAVNVVVHPLHLSQFWAASTMLFHMTMIVSIAVFCHKRINKTMKFW